MPCLEPIKLIGLYFAGSSDVIRSRKGIRYDMVVLDLALAVFAIRQFQVETLGLHLKIGRGREGCRRCGQREEKGTDGK